MSSGIRITAILPVFNEEGALEPTVRAVHRMLEAHAEGFEILVVDDGSSDGTRGISESLALPGCRVIRNEVNVGYGYSIKKGLHLARFPWVLICDVDGSYPPDAIPDLIRRIPDSDMVVGARPAGLAGDSFPRWVGKSMIRGLAGVLVPYPIPDLNSGLRIVRKDLLEKYFWMLPDGFSLTSTITLALLINAYRVAYVPIRYKPRLGVSKIRPFRDTMSFLHLIVRSVVYFNPLKIFLPLSLCAGILGILSAAYDVFVLRNITEKTVVLWVSFLLFFAVGALANSKDGGR